MNTPENLYEAMGPGGRAMVYESVDTMLRGMKHGHECAVTILGPDGGRLLLLLTWEKTDTARAIIEIASKADDLKAWEEKVEYPRGDE